MRPLTESVSRVDVLTAELRKAMDGSADEAATQDGYSEVVRSTKKQRRMVEAI